MLSKERVRVTLAHEEPDRVPVYAGFTPEIQALLQARFPEASDMGIYLGNDVVCSYVGVSNSFYVSDEAEYTCEWGITWRRVPFSGGHYTDMAKHPLADESAIDSYIVPDAANDARYEETRRIVETYGPTHWIAGNLRCTIFECSWYLRGQEKLMMDMIQRKDVAAAIMDKVMEFSLPAGKKLIELGIDMLWTGDDVGMQTGMLISPQLWREFLKPRYAYLLQEFKKINPDIVICYHSDGYITPIIPELIEIGIEVLNPVQPWCMDPSEIKREYGDNLSFLGTIDLQHTLPFGSVDDVQAEVRKRVETMARGGGLILGPAHDIQPDTSIDNILAFYEAAREFGVYPIRLS